MLFIVTLLVGVFLLGCGTPRPTEGAFPTEASTAPPSSATVSPLPATTTRPTGIVSAPQNLSAGDPYAPELGNAGYDVQGYTLQLALDPRVLFIDGHVMIDAASTVDGLDQVSLDLIGFEIGQVSIDGRPASSFRQGDKLLVDLPAPLSAGAPFSLAIAYSGEPVVEPSIYVPFASHVGLFEHLGQRMCVVAEPDGARYWFPSNDHPRDKATFRFEITVPQGLTAVANGVLVETRSALPSAFADGIPSDLYVWEHRYPMATAFATVAVGDYQRVEGTSPGGVPLRHYVFPEYSYVFEQMTPVIGEMIDWMGEMFGPYPFEAFGYVTVSGLGGASLETQTMVILSEEGMFDETLLAHEMAHMWFGDWVSLDSWGDMWRSEGFATYVQMLWGAHGDPAALEGYLDQLRQILEEGGSDHALNDPPPAKLFGPDTYFKGALLVHALRQEMGDEAFFEGLRAYFARYGGGTATHAQFQAVLEEAAGFPLNEFFERWFE